MCAGGLALIRCFRTGRRTAGLAVTVRLVRALAVFFTDFDRAERLTTRFAVRGRLTGRRGAPDFVAVFRRADRPAVLRLAIRESFSEP